MKSFSIKGPAVKAFFGLNAKTIGNPKGNEAGSGGGSRPPAPALAPAARGTNFAIIYWSAVPTATYKLFRGVDGATPTLFQSLTDTFFQDNTITVGHTYVYYVASVVGGVSSVPSPEITVTTGTTLALTIAADHIVALNNDGVGLALSALMSAPQIAAWEGGTYTTITIAMSGAPVRGYWVVSGGVSNVGAGSGPGFVIDIFNGAGDSNIIIQSGTGFRMYGGGGFGAAHSVANAQPGGDAIQIASAAAVCNLFLDNGASFLLGGGGGGGGDITNVNTGGGGGAAGWRAVGTLGFDTAHYFDLNCPMPPPGPRTGDLNMTGALGAPSGGIGGCGSGGGLGQDGFPDGANINLGAAGGKGVNRNGTPGATVILSGGGNIKGIVQ